MVSRGLWSGLAPVALAACSAGTDLGTDLGTDRGEEGGAEPAPISIPIAEAALIDDVAAEQVQPVRLGDGRMIAWMVEEAGEDALYRSGEIDLDGDGYNDSLIYLGGSGRCGSGGCNLYIHRVTPDGNERLGRTTVTQLPVGVLDSSTNGMRDIVVTIGGGGIREPGLRVLRFDGEAYPSNPTVEPAETVDSLGTKVISAGDMRPIAY